MKRLGLLRTAYLQSSSTMSAWISLFPRFYSNSQVHLRIVRRVGCTGFEIAGCWWGLRCVQLSRIVYLFSRNVHDSSLPLSVQTTCVRLMLNLVNISTQMLFIDCVFILFHVVMAPCDNEFVNLTRCITRLSV